MIAMTYWTTAEGDLHVMAQTDHGCRFTGKFSGQERLTFRQTRRKIYRKFEDELLANGTLVEDPALGLVCNPTRCKGVHHEAPVEVSEAGDVD